MQSESRVGAVASIRIPSMWPGSDSGYNDISELS